MATVSAILIIAGIVIMFVGLGLVVFANKDTKVAEAQSLVSDTADLIKEIGKFLDGFEARFRAGFAVMFFGLALVVGGLALELKDVKNAVKDNAPATTTTAK